MKPFASTRNTTFAINVKLLFAFGFGCTSWIIWPETAEGWGYGLLSVLFGIGAVNLLVDAIKLMVKVHGYERALRDYVAQGPAPKSSEMATGDQLRKAGMR